MPNEFHVHINAYNINDKSVKKLFSSGFKEDPFIQNVDHIYAPKFHYSSYDSTSVKQRDSIFNIGLNIIQNDTSFVGYIESETLPTKLKTYFEEKPFNIKLIKDFPFKKIALNEVPLNQFKACDIHIDRAGSLPRDTLDDLLLNCGFYEVHTKTITMPEQIDERIFTIQTQSSFDAKLLYQQLESFFSCAGGIRKIEMEITNNLIRIPETFELVPFVPKNYFKLCL